MGLFGITVEVTFPVTGASWYQELEEVAGHIAFPVKKGESCECFNSGFPFYTIHDPSPRRIPEVCLHISINLIIITLSQTCPELIIILTIIIKKRVAQAGK